MNSTALFDAANRIEASSGVLATRIVARMDDQLRWFRALPAEQRSWVTLVAQAGISSFVEWLRQPDHKLRLTGDVFGAAPRELARRVNLQQTVELVEVTISVVEEQVPDIVGPDLGPDVYGAVLRFSREIAFAAARVYAAAAESRGAWDARLEALVIDGLVRISADGDDASPVSQAAALGWTTSGPVAAVVGAASGRPDTEVIGAAHRVARRLKLDVLAGVHGGRMVILLGGVEDDQAALTAATALATEFGPGPIVFSPLGAGLESAGRVTRAALSGLQAATAWPDAPRPVSADDLLPERALGGDEDARQLLVSQIYDALATSGDVLLDTVSAFLDSGSALEGTARTLFVHPNTVRYRLRRAAEVCGQVPSSPRGAWTLRVALALGRLDARS